MPAPFTPQTPSPAPHKQAGVEALFSAAFTGGGVSLASLVAAAHSAFPAQTAVAASAITAALAFLRKEAPYVRDAVKLWNSVRKDAAVQKAVAKLANTQAFKDAVKAEKESEKAVESNPIADKLVDAAVAEVKTAVEETVAPAAGPQVL